MNIESVKEQLRPIIIEELGIDCTAIDPAESLRDQVALDSMQFVGLIARVECVLDIELPLSILQVSTLEEFYCAVNKAMSVFGDGS